jgi:two-component system OmpR family response regulator
VRRAGTRSTEAEGIRAARIPDAQQRPAVTRSLIIEHVWDIHFDSISNVVEVHINSLRNKIDRGFGVR